MAVVPFAEKGLPMGDLVKKKKMGDLVGQRRLNEYDKCQPVPGCGRSQRRCGMWQNP